jgi:PhnB protein
MKHLNVYLNFAGTCRQAMEFYRDAIGGEIISMQYMSDVPGQEIPNAFQHYVMHAEYRCEHIHLMASDIMPEHPAIQTGNNVHLSINSTDLEEQARIFERLSDGGVVTMPLEDTFWGARFGMLVDQFGISWMMNCELNGQSS